MAHLLGPGTAAGLAASGVDGAGKTRQTVLVDQDGVASGTTGPACRCCGKPLPEGNLAWDYPGPDPVALLSAEDLAQRTLFHSQRVMGVTGLGNFTQVILPVLVEHDRAATLGIWLAVPEPAGERVMKAGRDRLLAKVLTSTWPEEMIRSARSRHTPSDMTGGPTPDPYAG
jgi:hypothetical protein